MSADEKPRLKRIGCYWLDEAVLAEGYGLVDVFNSERPLLELPELMDSVKTASIGGMLCPSRDQQTQVDLK
jgi:hypothetical protein